MVRRRRPDRRAWLVKRGAGSSVTRGRRTGIVSLGTVAGLLNRALGFRHASRQRLSFSAEHGAFKPPPMGGTCPLGAGDKIQCDGGGYVASSRHRLVRPARRSPTNKACRVGSSRRRRFDRHIDHFRRPRTGVRCRVKPNAKSGCTRLIPPSRIESSRSMKKSILSTILPSRLQSAATAGRLEALEQLRGRAKHTNRVYAAVVMGCWRFSLHVGDLSWIELGKHVGSRL